jgi:hypothetical protein
MDDRLRVGSFASGATYVALVFLGSRVAMVFAGTALVAAIVAVVLTFRR